MKSQARLIDTFQIVGFTVSTAVALVLVIADIDPVISTLLGLVLAVLVQLFDSQLRHSSSEDRLLQAQALSQALHRDEKLLNKVRQMVDDYYHVKDGWYEFFKLRADEALEECHRVLRSLAEGHMEAPTGSRFSPMFDAVRYAKKSLKGVTDIAYLAWAPDSMVAAFVQSRVEARQRGIEIIQVSIRPRELTPDIVEMSKRFYKRFATASDMVSQNYMVLSDELPAELDENYMIVDDCAVIFLERSADGKLKEESVSIDPVEVERMCKRFDSVLRYAEKADDFLAEVKSTPPGQQDE